MLLCSSRFALRDAVGTDLLVDEVQYRVQRTADELLDPNGGWMTVAFTQVNKSSDLGISPDEAQNSVLDDNWVNLVP